MPSEASLIDALGLCHENLTAQMVCLDQLSEVRNGHHGAVQEHSQVRRSSSGKRSAWNQAPAHASLQLFQAF